MKINGAVMDNVESSQGKFGFVIFVLDKVTELWNKIPVIYKEERACLDALHKIREKNEAYYNYANSAEDVKKRRDEKRKQYNTSRNPMKRKSVMSCQ